MHNIQVAFCEDLLKQECIDNIVYVEKKRHLDYLSKDNNGVKLLKFGDVIPSDNEKIKSNTQDGMHYSITISNELNSINIKSDWLNLLPIYYYIEDKRAFVSSSYRKMISLIKNCKPDNLFYPELVLFYTPLQGRTYYDSIKRLQFGSEINISPKGLFIRSYKRFYDLFSFAPIKFNKSIHCATDLYIEKVKKYLQDESVVSLTGGFDGRTNVACAHYYKVHYSTYSYGRIGNYDVDIPLMIASKLPVDYHLIELGDNYLQTSYKQCVMEYLLNTGGLNGFRSPQTLYSVKTISELSKIIITGFIGSELLRSCREPDAEVLSFCVRDVLIGTPRKNNYAYKIANVMNKIDLLANEKIVDIILDELEDYLIKLPKELTINQKYTILLYEYIISYVFGPWIYNGMKYAKIRNPYIDLDFFTYISQTKVSGFYANFLEQNMIKRRKNLMIYGNIISKTWPAIGKLPMSKGYSPLEVLYPLGIGVLVSKYMRPQKKDVYGLDKLNTVSGATKYLNKMNNNFINNQLINTEYINSMLDKDAYYRDIAFWALSKIAYAKIQKI